MRVGWVSALAAFSLAASACGVGTDAADGPSITQLPEASASSTAVPSVDVEPIVSDATSVPVEPRVSLDSADTAVSAPPTTTTTTTTSTSSTTTTTSTSTTTTTTTSTTSTVPAVDPIVVASPTPGAQATACTSVAVIGDSTAVGIDGSTGVIAADQAIIAKLAAIGVFDVRLDISGGRSIVETLPGQTNGAEAITALRSGGFDGCWVIALGTNDAANIAAGSNADAAVRVERIIEATGGGRVLWINASTTTTTGYWARNNIVQWNNDLASLLAGRGNVGLADWDALASQNAWFVSDGIHPNGTGLAARSQFFADSLRAFFPA